MFYLLHWGSCQERPRCEPWATAMLANPDTTTTIMPKVNTNQRGKATPPAGTGSLGGAAPNEKRNRH